jgi:hypothetical protein
MKFKNGWKISVQWGPTNYCDHSITKKKAIPKPEKADMWESGTAEVAIMDPDGNITGPGDNYGTEEDPLYDVEGWCSTERVADLIEEVRKKT